MPSRISIAGATEETDRDLRYAAVLQDRQGPCNPRADLALVLDERDEGRRIHARADGEDRRIGSRVIIDVTLAPPAADDVVNSARGALANGAAA